MTKEMNELMPINFVNYKIEGNAGLVIVDEINGFCTPGYGPLAPMSENDQVNRMIAETDVMARKFLDRGMSVMAFCDTHVEDRPEPPYPEHCVVGSGQEELVDKLKWLEEHPNVEILKKDVINGFVGGVLGDGSNRLIDWVRKNNIETLVFQGICTDICVLDVVVTMLSVRNHYINMYEGHVPMLPGLKNIVVHEPGCATYDMTYETVKDLGLPATAVHDQEFFHRVGLSVMQARGAIIADSVEF